jgi:ATP-binding cassette subfamily B protein RaxB
VRRLRRAVLLGVCKPTQSCINIGGQPLEQFGIDHWRAQVGTVMQDDVMRMPMGYQTPVGDMGTTLSGGQKQRILLARAFHRRPRVLLLDEATSHLDTEREADIGRAIAGLKVTRIVIAHRLQTLASVDRVVEMSGGRIVRDETASEFRRRMGLHIQPEAVA